jgi:hypothetical protein
MSEVKVNKISPRTNCGTVQLGDSGDTITIPAGATITNNGTQTGFGRTGTVNWDTTAKTGSFTAVSGNGYFVNTTSASLTVTLPTSPSAGDIVAVADYAGTAATNNIIIARNGSNIEGGTADARIYENRDAITLVYVDGTQGWVPVNNNEKSGILPPAYVAATGGTITCCGDYKIHTFTGPGTFTVSCAGNSLGSNTVDYLVVAGGGSGGGEIGNGYGSGAGGAGGYRESSGAASGCYSASPLGACVAALPVTAQGYPITVGGGGAGISEPAPGVAGNSGVNSIFSTITSAGGGGGGNGSGDLSGGDGGSGGGAYGSKGAPGVGTGNTPPVSPPQGNPGGEGRNTPYAAGGGGGATQAGQNGITSPQTGGAGGAGATSSINGTPTARAGGGGGGVYRSGPFGDTGVGGAGGTGGGGPGGPGTGDGQAGTANTGGGGGGASTGNTPTYATNSGAGGSGIVIIRYKFQ